jgi:3-phosphoshikimate 1-carboxyvinyltransferase
VPALAALAAFSTGPTRIYNAGRLRHKESDRLAASADMVGALGGDISVTADGLLIRGQPLLAGGHCSSHGDHRIAMAAAVAGANTDRGATLEDYKCVNKSYPGFFNDFIRLGGSADGLDMG